MSPKAVVFDLDGTLVDSLPDLTAAINVMLHSLGRRPLAPGEVRRMIGDGTRVLVPSALAATTPKSISVMSESEKSNLGLSSADVDDAHRKFLEAYEAAATKLSRLYPGVEQTLKLLQKSGIRLGICTNKQQQATFTVLRGFGIASYFEAIVGGDVVPHHKPDPRHLLAVTEQLGVRSREAIMIGDSENDYNAARAAGTGVILLRYGYLRVLPETLSPDAWLDSFSEIPQAITTF